MCPRVEGSLVELSRGTRWNLGSSKIHRCVTDAFKNVLADFAKKPLAERGGTSPPLTENCRKFSSKNGSKRAKIGIFWPKIAVF